MLGIFYDGPLTQLLSTPGDFWVNKWLYDNYDDLRREQRAGLSEIFEKAHQALGDHIKALTPRTVYNASNAMNAALADFVDELFGCEEFTRPYRGTEFTDIGARLRSHNLTDRGYAGDIETTDKWAGELGLEGSYGWRIL